jgi:hypothetical protein
VAYSKTTYKSQQQNDLYSQFLKRCFLHHSILAVGFSFTDPIFVEMLHYVRDSFGGSTARPHLVILPKSSRADLQLLASCGFEHLTYDDSSGHSYPISCVEHLAKPAFRARLKLERDGGGLSKFRSEIAVAG